MFEVDISVIQFLQTATSGGMSTTDLLCDVLFKIVKRSNLRCLMCLVDIFSSLVKIGRLLGRSFKKALMLFFLPVKTHTTDDDVLLISPRRL